MPEKLPCVLSVEEVDCFFNAIALLRHRAVMMLCYGSGLRISEACGLQVGDIDSNRILVGVQQGWGGKDRFTVLSYHMLTILRPYWKIDHPQKWLFPTAHPDEHIHPAAIQKICRDAAFLAR